MSRVTLPSRVVDYCIVVGAQVSSRASITAPASPLVPNLSNSSSNSLSLPSSAPLPLHPSPVKPLQPGETAPLSRHRPHPAILQRFPPVDHSDAECPKDISMFAFPSLTFDLSPTRQERQVWSVVLTEADGSRVYVSCLRWWEKADELMTRAMGGLAAQGRRGTIGKLSEDGTLISLASTASPPLLYAPKCVLLTSHWPFFTQMENYLTALYPFLLPSSHPLPYPLERSLQNLIIETPLPPPGQLQVEAHPLPSLTLLFQRPPPNALPLHDFSTLYLFRLLSPENFLTVFAAASTEKRILFLSSHLHRLTLSAESLLSFLFPFFWRNIYIPLPPPPPSPLLPQLPPPHPPSPPLLTLLLPINSPLLH